MTVPPESFTDFLTVITWNTLSTWVSHIIDFKAILVQPSGGMKNVTVLAFAGTDSVMDVVVDLNQVTGGMAPQYPRSLSVAMQCQSSSNNLFLTEHSLGGGLAAYCSVETRVSASTINPAPLVSMGSFSAMFGRNPQIKTTLRTEAKLSVVRRDEIPGRTWRFQRRIFFIRHSLINTAPAFRFRSDYKQQI